MVGLLIYLYVAEPIVARIPALQDWTRYLPGAAEDALTRTAYNDLSVLEPWQGGVVFAGWSIALAVAGTLLTLRRDIA